jgi:hypothetical protein
MPRQALAGGATASSVSRLVQDRCGLIKPEHLEMTGVPTGGTQPFPLNLRCSNRKRARRKRHNLLMRLRRTRVVHGFGQLSGLRSSSSWRRPHACAGSGDDDSIRFGPVVLFCSTKLHAARCSLSRSRSRSSAADHTSVIIAARGGGGCPCLVRRARRYDDW